MKKILLALSILIMCSTMTFANSADKPMRFGGQILYGLDDLGLGLGGRFEMDLDQYYPNLFLASNFNLYFPDEESGVDMTAWQLTVNALYKVGQNNNMTFYTGGGLCYDYVKVEVDSSWGSYSADDSEMGIELVGGIKYPIKDFAGFSELKFSIGGFEELIITTGILF